MAGTFELIMNGDPITEGGAQVMVNILRSRFGTFSSDHTVDLIHFAGISYRIVVKGTPDNFDYLDNMMKAVNLYIPRYLRKWHYELEVNFRERG